MGMFQRIATGPALPAASELPDDVGASSVAASSVAGGDAPPSPLREDGEQYYGNEACVAACLGVAVSMRWLTPVVSSLSPAAATTLCRSTTNHSSDLKTMHRWVRPRRRVLTPRMRTELLTMTPDRCVLGQLRAVGSPRLTFSRRRVRRCLQLLMEDVAHMSPARDDTEPVSDARDPDKLGNMMHVLDNMMHSTGEVVYQDMARGKSRQLAAECFFKLLKLKSLDVVEVDQNSAFGDIVVTKTVRITVA